MNQIYDELIRLGNKSKRIKCYKPASIKQIMRSENNIPGGKVIPDLIELYKLSNGASVLDYCLAGCKNGKIIDIAENTSEIWCVNVNLIDDFMGFLTNSQGENFGYLLKTKDQDGNHPVAYLKSISDTGMIIISSSIKQFFRMFLSKIDETLAHSPNELYIGNNWPLNLIEWLNFDPNLLSMYQNKELQKYYQKDDEIQKYVEKCVDTFTS